MPDVKFGVSRRVRSDVNARRIVFENKRDFVKVSKTATDEEIGKIVRETVARRWKGWQLSGYVLPRKKES